MIPPVRYCPLNCSSFSTPYNLCHKCEVFNLKHKIKELEHRLNYIENKSHKIFDHTSTKEMSLKHTLYSDFSNNQWKFTKQNSYFITITFDPDKFGHSNQSHDEKVYIMYELEQAYRKELIYDYYGCFEKQSNGTIHAHFVCYSNNIYELRKRLKRAFTDDPYNHRAVDIGSAKESRSIQYIETEVGENKQKFGFFYNYKKSSVASVDVNRWGTGPDEVDLNKLLLSESNGVTQAVSSSKKVYNITDQIKREVDMKHKYIIWPEDYEVQEILKSI